MVATQRPRTKEGMNRVLKVKRRGKEYRVTSVVLDGNAWTCTIDSGSAHFQGSGQTIEQALQSAAKAAQDTLLEALERD